VWQGFGDENDQATQFCRGMPKMMTELAAGKMFIIVLWTWWSDQESG
jgi:hypothetical protein